MIRMVLRKMWNNPWMMACLLIGSILAVAMVSSIPMYTDGVLQRMLTGELEDYQLDTGYYPGRYHVKGSFYSNYAQEDRAKAYRVLDRTITKERIPEIHLPVISRAKTVTMDYFAALPEPQREEEPKRRNVKIDGVQGLGKHAKILHGRLFSGEKQGDCYEVIVTEQAMKDLDLRLEETYVVTDLLKRAPRPLKFKVVGVFGMKDPQDPYWFQNLSAYKSSFLMDFDRMTQDFVREDSPLLSDAQWYFAFDYHAMTLDAIKRVLEAGKIHKAYFSEYRSLEWKFPVISILEEYSTREVQLKRTLWMLQIPILLMLAFYLFMVSQLIIENEGKEIAVLKSRGGSGLQVFGSYFLESLILGLTALLLGPPLGMFLCNILGASNGFLEFVQRTALPIHLSWKAYLYSLWTVLLFMLTMLIPASFASRTNIVRYNQKKSRGSRQPIWKRFYLDIVLLGVSVYGLHAYYTRQNILHVTDVEASAVSVDPLLFLISTLFILGAGLVFLRIYPLLIRFVFWLGKKKWSPVFYASFIQVGRSGGQNQFLMLFLIMTLSIGIFNANAARTINTNYEERIRYENGADIIADAYWPNNASSGDLGPSMGEESSADAAKKEPIEYQEPPFGPFENLKGIREATRVFVKDDVHVSGMDKEASHVRLMGILPDEFGRVAWFRGDLLPHHINEYLNLMAQDPRAVLLSSSFREKYEVKEGDSVFLTWGDQGMMECVVYAFVDYWPTFNPSQRDQQKEKPEFVVASYSYIRSGMALEPYQIWLDKAQGAKSEEVYNDIKKKEIEIVSLKDTDQAIIQMKKDPMVRGINGVLTLGFIVTMVICMVGFLIYWILSIQRRALNFGIFRAIGLPGRKVIGMLACEQLLISGLSIGMGIVIGLVSSEWFVPLLQIANNAAEQVPPFHVVANPMDLMRIFGVVFLMLAVCLLTLGVLISRIRIAQVIKLGED